MKLYEVKAGTMGSVFSQDMTKIKAHWAMKEDQIFQDYEMIFDPVANYNGRVQDALHQELANRGLAGFMRQGKKSAELFIFVVPYASVNVMC